MQRRTLILTNGELLNKSALTVRIEKWNPDQVIAANGGSRHAPMLGLDIDLVVGDLDSIGAAQHQSLLSRGTQFEHFQAEKDETDLELALLRAVEQGATEIAIVGVVGDRLDMVMANILLLTQKMLVPVRVELWLGHQTAWLIRPPGGEITGKAGDTVSLIPLEGDAIGVSTTGLSYSLHGERLFFGPARGVSNEMLEDVCHVDLEAGLLFAVHTKAS